MDYSMDIFNEQIIKVSNSFKMVLIKIGIIAAALLSSILLFTYFIEYYYIISYVIIGIWILVLFLFRQLSIEYEYAFTNGDLDIDKIVAKRKRKRIISVSIKELDKIAPTTARNYENDIYSIPKNKVYNCSSRSSATAYYAIFSTSNEGRVCIIFEPNKKMMQAMRKLNPGKFMNFEF